MIITAERVRSVIAGARTEQDITGILRAHKIRYGYTTEGGFLNIKVPCRKGAIRIYRTCSRSCPFAIIAQKAR